MALGPVQLLVVGFGENAKFNGSALEELHRLSEHDIVRLVDLLVVSKDEAGKVSQVEIADRPELEQYGALAGALVGLGAAGEEGMVAGAVAGAEAAADGMYDPDQVWLLADAIPPGMTAAIGLLEHRWAIPLRDAILDNDGVILADEWMHPEDLVRYGAEAGRVRAPRVERARGAAGGPCGPPAAPRGIGPHRRAGRGIE